MSTLTFPDIKLPQELNLTLDVPEIPVPQEEDIKSHLINYQYYKAEVTPVVGTLKEGQRLVVGLYFTDFEKRVLPQTVRLGVMGVLRTDFVCPELFKALLEAEVGETGMVKLEQVQTLKKLKLESPCLLHFHVQEAYDLALPPLDSHFPQRCGYDNYKELYEALAAELIQGRQVVWNKWVKRQLLYQVMDQVQLEPQSLQELYEAEVVSRWEHNEEPKLKSLGVTEKSLDMAFEMWCDNADVQKEVWTTLKSSLVLKALTTRLELDATLEEIHAEVQEAAEAFGQDYPALVAYFQEHGHMPTVASRVTTEKVMDWLMENATLLLNGEPI